LPSKHTKIIPVVSVVGLPPKNLYDKRFENMSIFRFGLHQACATFFTGGPISNFETLSRAASIFIG